MFGAISRPGRLLKRWFRLPSGAFGAFLAEHVAPRGHFVIRRGPKRRQRAPKGGQRAPKGNQKEAQGRPKCIQKSMPEKCHENGAKRMRQATVCQTILGAIFDEKSIEPMRTSTPDK